MKPIIRLSITLYLIVLTYNASGAYLISFPQEITQPNGLVINCYVSGDEYYNWLHDSNNYTIIQDSITDYFCYAMLRNGKIVASEFIVGANNPTLTGIQPGVQLSMLQVLELRSKSSLNFPEEPELEKKSGVIETVRTLNNLVVYIRFADQSEFEPKQAIYSSYFNNDSIGANSMYNYFREASYQKLNIISTFYPLNDGAQILSYQDNHSRNYYCPYTAENDSGYSVVDNGKMLNNREWTLITNAMNYIKDQIPSTLNIDTDNDGKVDNICFIIKGMPLTPTKPNTTLLWPHSHKMYYGKEYINSKRVFKYNFQLENYLDYKQNGVLCHEMFHTIGGGDLYQASGKFRPVGPWDLMAETKNPPQSMCADYKYRYGRWISEIPEIKTSGHYTLNPITSAHNNCYQIKSLNESEYFMLEFRQKTGTFESSLPGTGLIIYRIMRSACCRNIGGPPDWIYIYRPNGTNEVNGDVGDAYFDEAVGRSTFDDTSNPNCFLSDGSMGNIFIENIKVSGNSVSFDVRFCQDTDVLFSNTNQLPQHTKTLKQIATSGIVKVNKNDDIHFEAEHGILLNAGFEIEPGGQFKTNINCNCNR